MAWGVTVSVTAAWRRCRGPGHCGIARRGSWEFLLLHRESLTIINKVTPVVLVCTGLRAEASPGHMDRAVQVPRTAMDTRDPPGITNLSSTHVLIPDGTL